MMPADAKRARRILVVDDNASIHDDFRRVLDPARPSSALCNLEEELFGAPRRVESGPTFTIDTALQGRVGADMLARAVQQKQPYVLAFVDMRMPPGWDGVETIVHMWQIDPDLEVVICSAYSDYSWSEVLSRVNRPGLRLLKKPFESREVLDLAYQLTAKGLRRRADAR